MTAIAPQYYTNPERWAEKVVAQYAEHARTSNALDTLVVSDVCDTLINANKAWHADFTQLAIEKGFDPDSLPDPASFAQLTPRTCFTDLKLVRDYSAYKAERMHNVMFHARMEVLDDAAVLRKSASSNLPGAYSSTRPAVLGNVTKWHLQKLGFAAVPLLVRPEEVPYEETIAFKVTAGHILRQAMDAALFTDTTVEYVDDYPDAVEAINALAQDRLVGTHYGPHESWRKITRRILHSC